MKTKAFLGASVAALLTAAFSGCMDSYATIPANEMARSDVRGPDRDDLFYGGLYVPVKNPKKDMTSSPFALDPLPVDPAKRPDWVRFDWQKNEPHTLALQLDYVLPERFLDEKVRPWREEMFRRFGPLVKDCKTREEAILLIAKNAAKVCGVEYSTKRRAANQGVMESLESHKASCTGLSILLAAAYRSVGIPARLAGVGEWGDRPGNHTWVEVWDGDWHAIEYYPDAKGWDHGWFYEPVVNYDPANPRSRVMAVSPSGKESFYLPWAENDTSVHAVDRMDAYQKVAASLGVRRTKARPGMTLVPVTAADPSGVRYAVSFRVLDGPVEVFAARTPGPLDDLNNLPRAELSPGKTYVFEYTDKSGAKRTKSVAVEADLAVVLPL